MQDEEGGHSKAFLEIKQAFDTAESAIKECEILIGELPQGAVNELRYAAAHLIDYIISEDQDSLSKYERHCRRAMYDSRELQILMLKGRIDEYLQSYKGYEDILADILNAEAYETILNRRNETNQFIITASQNKETREDYLNDMQKALPDIQDNLSKLEALAPAVRARIKKQKRNIRLALLAIFISGIGTVATFLSLPS